MILNLIFLVTEPSLDLHPDTERAENPLAEVENLLHLEDAAQVITEDLIVDTIHVIADIVDIIQEDLIILKEVSFIHKVHALVEDSWRKRLDPLHVK